MKTQHNTSTTVSTKKINPCATQKIFSEPHVNWFLLKSALWLTLIKKLYFELDMGVYTFNPKTQRRQRKINLSEFKASSLHTEFQASQGYTKRLYRG